MNTATSETPEPAREPSAIERMNRQRAKRIRTYRERPEAAKIVDGARTHQTRYAPTDPFHAELEVGLGYDGDNLSVGVHRALGGLHDLPNPGDILCAALAACTDSTLRQIAGQLKVHIERLSVTVKGDIDVRGTLCVSTDVPVGFQQMRIMVDLELAKDTNPRHREKLMAATEYCCVVLQTLRTGVPISMTLTDAAGEPAEASEASQE
ncbi:MAG: OsmC family protein [Myxococcota bacterium]